MEGKCRFPNEVLIKLERHWWRGGQVKQQSVVWTNFPAILMYLSLVVAVEATKRYLDQLHSYSNVSVLWP